jgi:hypothetical protein
MKIDSLKELEALVKMCNKHGVSNIEVDNIKLKLDGPPELKTELQSNDQSNTEKLFSDEDLLFWSA